MIFIHFKEWFIQRPTVEEFQGVRKISPAYVILVPGQLNEHQLKIWSLANKMKQRCFKVINAVVLFVLCCYWLG